MEDNINVSKADVESVFKVYESPFHVTETPVEASKCQAKTKMLIFLRDLIERARWSNAEAAKKLGIDPARVSNLLRGKIDLFTIDYLMTLMDRLGVPVVFEQKGDSSIHFEIKMPNIA